MNSNKGRNPGKRVAPEQFVNAAPGDDDDMAMSIGRPPQNIGETQAWKASKRGAGRMWNNYKNHLSTSFNRMDRADQEALVQRICVIVTLGVTGIALLLFYQFIPRLGRVFGVPAAIFGAYWVGKTIVTPVVLDRLSNLLNSD
jgi:hypothetical protein